VGQLSQQIPGKTEESTRHFSQKDGIRVEIWNREMWQWDGIDWDWLTGKSGVTGGARHHEVLNEWL
jgi:hypothetical protein